MLTRFVPAPGARLAPRRIALVVALAIVSLALASVVVGVLESQLAIPDASAVFIVSVVVVATVFGTTPAVFTAIAAFVVYDFFFTRPYFTLVVSDPVEWVNLVLFLLIAVVVGRLAALQQERAADADRRAREAQALFAISRTLATATSVAEAAPAVLARLASDSGMDRVWFAVTAGTGERTILDSAPDHPRPRPRSQWTLLRTPGDKPAQWLRTHVGGEAARPGRTALLNGARHMTDALFRVKIEADGKTVGSLWATRPAGVGLPNREQSRLIALAADQLGLAVHRDELTASSTAAEVARQSDALKSALLTSVSHDLRTPLASIRAAAGSLMDPAIDLSGPDARSAARAIDSEADRLNRLVRNLLDLSRIEGGALRPDIEVLDLDETLQAVVARMEPVLPAMRVTVDLEPDLPPVRGDAVYLDEAVTNLLENAARYAGSAALVRISGQQDGDHEVRLTVEDDGPGVPAEALPRLFEKFYRVGAQGDGSRRGMGIGMSIVKGLIEAMGGTTVARRSDLGGLAVDIRLPSVAVPAAAVL